MGTIERSTKMSASSPQIEEIITEDGILRSILSFLPLIEAVRTSVLSPRWRHIWTHLTKLNFNAVSVLGADYIGDLTIDGKEAYKLLKGKTNLYLSSVNSLLKQIQDARDSARVEEFRVRYFLHKRHSLHLDAWVRFAVAWKTKVLSVHCFKPYSKSVIEPYDFPCHLLESSPSIETLTLICCSLRLPCEFGGLSCLKQVILDTVDVSEEDLNRLLSNCSSTLTRVGVWEANRLVSMTTSRHLSQLHNLLVQDCEQLKKIEINAPNLAKLYYRGVPIDFRFRQSSQLTDADICFKTRGTERPLDFYLNKLSSTLPHLRSLTLKLSGTKVAVSPKGSSSFNHLKRFDLEWYVFVKMTHLHLATLLDAAPFLEELKLRLSARVVEPPPLNLSELREMTPKRRHSCLRKIEVSGFCFDTWQIEMVVYLLNSATVLEAMIIERGREPSKEIQETDMKNICEEVAPNAKLLICDAA